MKSGVVAGNGRLPRIKRPTLGRGIEARDLRVKSLVENHVSGKERNIPKGTVSAPGVLPATLDQTDLR